MLYGSNHLNLDDDGRDVFAWFPLIPSRRGTVLIAALFGRLSEGGLCVRLHRAWEQGRHGREDAHNAAADDHHQRAPYCAR
jgi:hypothetical protein